MDIRYCDQCGDIIQGDGGSAKVGGQIICSRCDGGAPQGNVIPMQESAPKNARPQKEATDEIPEFTLSSVLHDEGLELFSSDTLAIRKQKPAKEKDSKKKTATRLKLVEDEPMVTQQIPSFAQPPDAPTPAADPAALANEQTMRITSPDPSLANADRWSVECQHCHGKLAIKPVQKRSKLRCPRCGGMQILDPSGSIHRIKEKSSAPPAQTQVAHFDLGLDLTQQPQQPSYSTQARSPQPEPQAQAPAPAPAPAPTPAPAPVSQEEEHEVYEEESPTQIVAKLAGLVRGETPESITTAHAPAAPPPPAQGPIDPFNAPAQAPPAAAFNPSPPEASQSFESSTATATAPEPTLQMPAPVQEPSGELEAAPKTPFQPPKRAAENESAWEQVSGALTPAALDPVDLEPEPINEMRSESMVLWIMIAGLPTFVALYLVSNLTSPETHQALHSHGTAAQQALEWLFSSLRGLF